MAYLGFSLCWGLGLAVRTSFAIWLRARQSCVDAAPTLCGRLVKLEEPELDCPFGKGGVEVEHMVAAVVVMLVPAVACAVAGVPDVRKLCHRLGLSAVDLGEKVGVYRAAVAAHAAAVEL